MQIIGVDCESFTLISIDSLIVYGNKYCLQIHIDNCVSKIANSQMVDYLGNNSFESD